MENKLIKSLIRDLVKLSVDTHRILLVAQIPVSHSKEASELMEACESIYKEFVVQEDENDSKD